jgi:hypothetical protein
MLVSESAVLETVGAGQLGTARHTDEAVTQARPVGGSYPYLLQFNLCTDLLSIIYDLLYTI